MRVLLGALLLWTAGGAQAPEYGQPGPFAVESFKGEWVDTTRNDRPVPYRIYCPTDASGPHPVVIVSHGLGGNRDVGRYLGEHFASHGYISVHLQHAGSDTDAVREQMASGRTLPAAMAAIVADVRSALDRPRDVSFAIDHLAEMNAPDGPLPGRLDLSRIAAAGHSYGAYTALAVAGQSGAGLTLRDPRVRSAIALSAPPPRRPAAYSAIEIPVMVMTGTLDDSPVGGGTATSRIEAFEQFRSNERYLVVFDGGDHMIFGDAGGVLARAGLPGMRGDRSRDEEFQAHIRALCLAFLEHTLREDAEAQRWLHEPGGAEASLQAVTTRYDVVTRQLKTTDQ